MRWWRREERERDLDREIRADLELEAEEQAGHGLSPEEACYAARRAFGNTTFACLPGMARHGGHRVSILGRHYGMNRAMPKDVFFPPGAREAAIPRSYQYRPAASAPRNPIFSSAGSVLST